METFSRDGAAELPYLPPEKPVCRSRNNRTDIEQQTGSKLGKEYIKAELSPCLFNFSAEYIMRNARLDEAQAGIKIAGRNTINLWYADDIILMAEIKEELKSVLRKVKEESEKAGLKLIIQKMKIMASGPMTSWQMDGEKMETVSDFTFLGSKITCSDEIKRCLFLGRKAMTKT